VRLIIEPADGVAPVAVRDQGARKSVEISIFRLDRKDVEMALTAAAAKGVRVTALIAFANRGGEKRLRQLELRLLAAGIIVARTSDDLTRYHGKYILIDRRVLYVLSFNFHTRPISITVGDSESSPASRTASRRRRSYSGLTACGRDMCRKSRRLW